ncbi:endonuclease [Pseudomonas sp. DWP3-1-2]|uniref:endonuclease n=1 Tax=Pseudomonas sp. DWP3-1-2 TaxID=2804645 RepID=UPI003CF19B30
MMVRLLTLLCTTLLLTAPLNTYAEAPHTFSQAKKIAWGIYAPQSTEFYCGCKYTGNKVDIAGCGYVPRKNATRARRIEWEHIVPAWQIGHLRQCWQHGGRKNCTKNDDIYQKAEADLHNLVPSIGEVNGDRSNFSFGWLPAKTGQYGSCLTQVDFKAKKVMPRPAIRGMIARTYFYMSKHYNLRLSRQDRQLYQAWNKTYPVEGWEQQRNQRVACVMGHGNEFVGKVDLKRCG